MSLSSSSKSVSNSAVRLLGGTSSGAVKILVGLSCTANLLNLKYTKRYQLQEEAFLLCVLWLFRKKEKQIREAVSNNQPPNHSFILVGFLASQLNIFFFFRWRYSPLWALACRTIPLHLSLSITNSLHLLTPNTWRSLSTSSPHPFLGSSSSSRPFQFFSEDFFGNPLLLHSLQVTQPTYPLPLYPFYYIFFFIQLF